MAPWGNTSTVTNMPQGWDNPWVAVPGGDPIPALLNGPERELDLPARRQLHDLSRSTCRRPSTDQWNVSYQRQIAADWMVSANYLGNVVRQRLDGRTRSTPPCSAPAPRSANTNQRRVLSLQNPAAGADYASIQELDPNGTSELQRAAAAGAAAPREGFSLQGNYTISRCTTDRWNQEPGVSWILRT